MIKTALRLTLRRTLRTIAAVAALCFATSCSVHEWYATEEDPDQPQPPVDNYEKGLYSLRLQFEPHFHQVDLNDDGTLGEAYRTYDNTHSQGYMHYFIRAFRIVDGTPERDHFEEFTFSRDISTGYECKYVLELSEGAYRVMVWTHMTPGPDDDHYYDASNFSEIRLTGEHTANTDYRDAFRGSVDITVKATDGHDAKPTPSTTLTLERPFAKFEFITTDLAAFINKQRSGANSLSLNDYQVVFYYNGFMPNAYSMHTDRNVDSATGVYFTSSLTQLNDNEASMGFDYVFVNDKETYVTLQIGLVSPATARQVALSDPVRVTLQRNHHVTVRGSFLTGDASGSGIIDPGFDGDINVPFVYQPK
ncbi:MAG: hypothetical protein J1F20_03470 [Muribaculaceae bacterium]|nr:hypothetical protein [Muribaculaceae bacterium]